MGDRGLKLYTGRNFSISRAVTFNKGHTW